MAYLGSADYWVVVAYFLLTFGVGVFALRRKHDSREDYFLSGRKLPWHLAGLSLVATTFAADTPLAVTGITVERGIAGNFLWLSLIPSGILTAIFYARLWRRSGVMTDAEFATIRYSGKSALFLRRFRALYLALPVNLIIMGWVTTGMAKVMQVFFAFPVWQSLAALYAFTLLYIVLSGLWGVVITDVLQFGIAMTACILLAVTATERVGGLAELWRKAELTLKPGTVQLYPWNSSLPVYAIAVWLGAQWWASWYPGFEPGGGGYVAQRLLSTRNENHAVAAALLFNLLHFIVRPWPWIITALAAAVALPATADKELLYPQAILAWMPDGYKGLMVAAFLAAFMSTIATHLNWGASYIVNDVLTGTRLAPKSERAAIIFSRLTVVCLAVAALSVSFLMTSVSAAWELILGLSAGTGPVYLLRWYWKRINAYSEISAMAGALFFSLLMLRFDYPHEIRLCWVALLNSLFWLVVTLCTPAEKQEKLASFEKIVHPERWRIRELIIFAASILALYTAFFLIGELLRGNWHQVGLNAFLLIASAAVIYALLRRRVFS